MEAINPDLDDLDDETIASLKAKVVELLEAQAVNDSKTISSLKAKVAELLDDAEEGWAYASPYFRDKWQWDDRVAEHLRYLKQFDIPNPETAANDS